MKRAISALYVNDIARGLSPPYRQRSITPVHKSVNDDISYEHDEKCWHLKLGLWVEALESSYLLIGEYRDRQKNEDYARKKEESNHIASSHLWEVVD